MNNKKLKEMNNIGLDEDDESETEETKNDGGENTSKFEAIPPFKDLYPNSDIIKCMKEYGPSIVPLPLIGMMMNYAGNHMLHYIWTQYKRKIFYPLHKITSIQLLANGEVLSTCKRMDCVIK